MLFRRLNWNIVGWFRVVSTISYLIIALGFGAMIKYEIVETVRYHPTMFQFSLRNSIG